MNILLLCSAALVLLFAALSINVSRIRRERRKDSDMTEAELTKAIRAHGNASEYIPLFVAIFLYLQSTQSSTGIYLTCIAVMATVSRFAHAVGMLRVAKVGVRHPLRFYGALGTYLSLVALGSALLIRAV